VHGGTGIGGGGDRSSFSTGELSSWDARSCWQRALVRAAGVGSSAADVDDLMSSRCVGAPGTRADVRRGVSD
jgi:hypothetical protein